MTVAHILGFPRIGAQRELKKALEGYWKGEITSATLEETARDLRARHWHWQRAAGLDSVAVGDFSFYDHVLDTSALLGVVPARFAWQGGDVDLDTTFRMARGVKRRLSDHGRKELKTRHVRLKVFRHRKHDLTDAPLRWPTNDE